MPRWESSAPRKKFPPPTTTDTCTPSRTTSAIWPASRATTSGSTPRLSAPNTSPESFSSTLRYRGPGVSPAVGSCSACGVPSRSMTSSGSVVVVSTLASPLGAAPVRPLLPCRPRGVSVPQAGDVRRERRPRRPARPSGPGRPVRRRALGHGRRTGIGSGADLEPGETGRVDAGLLEHLLHRLLVLLGERLLEQHVVLEEAVDPA